MSLEKKLAGCDGRASKRFVKADEGYGLSEIDSRFICKEFVIPESDEAQGSNNEGYNLDKILDNIRGVINGNIPDTEVFELTDKVESSKVANGVNMDAGIEQSSRSSAESLNGKTLEDIARELLKPQLQEWLNENLPGLVNAMVQKEIRKLMQQNE